MNQYEAPKQTPVKYSTVDKSTNRFQYLPSVDLLQMMDKQSYEKYEKELIESIYVNGYSDLYILDYVVEATQDTCPIYAENSKALPCLKGCEDFYEELPRKNFNSKFLYLSRDNKHFLSFGIIKEGDTVNLFVVNSSPKTSYLPKEEDNLIKAIFKSGVKRILVREFKPPIYQLGSFACFMYAFKNLKLMDSFFKEDLLNPKIINKLNADGRKCINENLFSSVSYVLLRNLGIDQSQNVKKYTILVLPVFQRKSFNIVQ